MTMWEASSKRFLAFSKKREDRSALFYISGVAGKLSNASKQDNKYKLKVDRGKSKTSGEDRYKKLEG